MRWTVSVDRGVLSLWILLSSASAALAVQFPESGAADGYDVAAYVWPAYHPEPRWAELDIFRAGFGEWQNVWEATPKWEGHRQPMVPLWGYESDSDPRAVARKIDAAVAHGVNVFIYDWYWYGGRPFLEEALDKGFLGASNNEKMKFFIMWANHHVTNLWDNRVGAKDWKKPIWTAHVGEDEFRVIGRRWIEQYFKRPNYYRYDGKPVLMIYELSRFIEGVGGLEQTRRALAGLRADCKAAGLGGLHVMICDAKVNPRSTVAYLNVDSASIYNFVQWASAEGDPEYTQWAMAAEKRFDTAREALGVSNYFAHASVGWDPNPRYPKDVRVGAVRDATPAKFEESLRRVKAWTDAHTPVGKRKLITVNAWNEWTEGSCLEPDAHWKFGYLEAIRNVFCPRSGN